MTPGVTALTVDIRLTMKGTGGPSFTLDVAFQVPPGVTVLFGPSGAGKSRTLACIAGLARADHGRIALGESVWFDARTREERPIHERRVALVFQSLALFPHMTGTANVAYGISRDVPAAQRRERAVAMLARMRVAHLADRKPRSFSGGEAQRVALARAFAMTPSVLLLDEPFSALDAAVKRELLDEAREWLARERIPSILVTHDEDEARVLGERVVFLDHGRVTSTAPVAAAFSRPLLLAPPGRDVQN